MWFASLADRLLGKGKSRRSVLWRAMAMDGCFRLRAVFNSGCRKRGLSEFLLVGVLNCPGVGL